MLEKLFTEIYHSFQNLAPHYSLTWAGHPIGHITTQAAELLASHKLAIRYTDTVSLPTEPQWEKIALALRDAGMLRGWRNELVDVWDGSRSIGAIERVASRPLGLRTQAVHLHAIDEQGRIWLGQRALNKSTDPGKWDTTAGGLVSHGETLYNALYRESFEEAGIVATQILPLAPMYNVCRVHRTLPEGFQIEDMIVLKCRLPREISPYNQDGEVAQFQRFTQDEIIAMIKQDELSKEAALILLHDFLTQQRLSIHK